MPPASLGALARTWARISSLLQRSVTAIVRLLPEGRPLPEDTWRHRHAAILILLWLHAIGLVGFGLVTGHSLTHSLTGAAVVAVAACLASPDQIRRELRAVVASLGLITSSAMLVHLSGGYIEMHFHFFVMVAVIALYQKWFTLLLAFAYVVLHHGLVGVLDPAVVYNHPDAWAQPWKWAAIHGGFVLSISIASLINWRFNEAVRAHAELLLNSAGEGIYGLGLDGTITFANPAAAAMVGYPVDELVGQPEHAILEQSPIRDRVASSVDTLDTAARQNGTDRGGAEAFRRKDGTKFPVECVRTPIRERGRLVGEVVTFKDITARSEAEERDRQLVRELRESQESLAHQALHDALTGLPNRSLLGDRLEQAMRTARREGEPLALLLIDLDRFKEVNDTLGHRCGDLLLRQVGQRLRAMLRASDTAGRLGGDEFAVVLPAADAAGATLVAERLLEALEEPFLIEEQGLEVRASIGIALYPEHGETAPSLLRGADVAMYVAKRAGCGFALFRPEQDQNNHDGLALVGELRRAIGRDELLLHYQPKVDIRRRLVTGVEALVRWRHPQRGIISPDGFIPVADQTGLIKPLTRWVLNGALLQCRAWRELGFEVPVAVNLSMHNLHDTEFPGMVSGLLGDYGVPPDWLCLEATESAVMADPTRTLDALRRLSAVGVRVAVDDFGTGYSSLSYLKQFPVHELKIDRAFVQDFATDGDNFAIVRATIQLGHALGLQVVAEGAEDEHALNLLEWLGCDAAQGYCLSPPRPAPELVPLLEGQLRPHVGAVSA